MITVVTDGSAALADALERIGLPVRGCALEKAARDAGFSLGSELTVMACRPGRHPLVEAEAFRHSTVLYAEAQADTGTVGPATAIGSAPCPACLAVEEDVSRARSDPRVLGWVAATVAMEVEVFRRHGMSTLLATSLSWSLGSEPGLTAATYPRREGCRTPGCAG